MIRPIAITEEEYRELSEDSGGYCRYCRQPAYGVEPDAQGYTCEGCGQPAVYGIEELLIRGEIEFKE